MISIRLLSVKKVTQIKNRYSKQNRGDKQLDDEHIDHDVIYIDDVSVFIMKMRHKRRRHYSFTLTIIPVALLGSVMYPVCWMSASWADSLMCMRNAGTKKNARSQRETSRTNEC